MNLKEALGIRAGGADLRGGGAHHDVAAVAALPDLHLALFKDLGGLDIVQQSAVTLFVALLDGSNQTEFGSKIGEALRFGGFGKALIHIGPLVIFALGGMQQVLRGIFSSMQLLIPHSGVGLLVFRGFEEDFRHLFIALVLCDRGKIGILVARLGLSGKGGFQILLGLGAGVSAGALGGGLFDQFKDGGGLLADGAELRGTVALVKISNYSSLSHNTESPNSHLMPHY